MTVSRKKLITGSVLLVGTSVLVVAGMAYFPSLQERYWIWKLESGTRQEQLEAATRLQELTSVRAIRVLIEVTGAAFGRSGLDWAVELPGSGLILMPISGDMPLPDPWVFVETIRQISKDRREPTERLLQMLLSDNRELVRAVAASVLFAGTDRAREYVSKERIVVVPRGIH